MKFTGFTGYKTGLLTPVFALRSAKSCGTGEFLDLIELGKFCNEAGLDLIQLLPVNDTGGDPSPYSALNAYALHPLFIRIADVPEYKTIKGENKNIEAGLKALKKFDAQERMSYHSVLSKKLEILGLIYEVHAAEIAAEKKFLTWITQNEWVKEYAVFRNLKEKNDEKSWIEWSEYRSPSMSEVMQLWDAESMASRNLFFAWIQYRLEEQFLKAAKSLNKMGIALKGDIPILMNEDSSDVWAHRDIFNLNLRAGAPPDMFAELGQNWGFPVYDWEKLRAADYGWWRLRLKQADKFYEAYRIDHVLGFFRIWAVPADHKEAILGYFDPSVFLSRQDLHSIGLDDGRINWLAEPHISGHSLREQFGAAGDTIISLCFHRIGDEDLFLFSPEIGGEKDILSLDIDEQHKQTLLHWFRDRSLIKISEDQFVPSWTFRACDRYQGLMDHEKHNFEELVARRGGESEKLWEHHGRQLLSFMRQTVEMLTCAEDLGVVPSCVPKVLDELDILGLKIPRWARKWGEPGDPFIKHTEYPFNSVCAPSVHDTSTLRAWWEFEEGREDFWRSLGFDEACPQTYDSETAKKVLSALLDCGSAIAVFQFQDFFALDETYRVSDPHAERINIPGTVQDSNWSYRIACKIEELKKDGNFTGLLAEIVRKRSGKIL